jgi:hypothetical protein
MDESTPLKSAFLENVRQIMWVGHYAIRTGHTYMKSFWTSEIFLDIHFLKLSKSDKLANKWERTGARYETLR